jgi:NADH-quinone oxidoreductase subunit G
MTNLVTLTIDDRQVQVPEGTLVVDAAMQVGIHIPVFCYHPKMKPAGMCRMCLVEVGRPLRNRETGEFERNEDGSLKIQFGSKLETSCTLPVSEGMVVRTNSASVQRARKDILEFLLTSHPLDCPICDKGGECPLQELTMDFGPGTSRFRYEEKMHLEKHFPLGELILLDRERCIQCGRCVRFQDEIVDDPVIGFAQRGRALQIVTFSNPGFDSYFSGNTTDICPVGALTTVDFRFGARPWEMKVAASICPHCPVGCNLAINIRREHKTGGGIVIKRIMPRQNEWVNEIWICDKGRLGYHYTEHQERLTQPLIRQNGELVPASWGEALDRVAQHLGERGKDLLTLVGGRLSNEDLFNLYRLTNHVGGKAALYTDMAGGDWIAKVGVAMGTNFSEMGEGTVILVVASDLLEEAPLYWLRVKQATERGAKLIVANPRPTKLERYATQSLRYPYGHEASLILAMLNALSAKRLDLPTAERGFPDRAEIQKAAQVFAQAQNAVILYGSEGTGLTSSRALAQACANLLIATNHIGKPNNGLIAVWQHGNTQGAWDMGFSPLDDLWAEINNSQALYVVAADPAGDDPALARAIREVDFVVVQELYLTETARLADVVLPAQAFTEREGTYTNGERRVQRFYPAIPARPHTQADFAIVAQIAERLKLSLEGRLPSKVMEQIAAHIEDYRQVTYQKLSEVVDQYPKIARADLYYGGTAYENRQGIGIQLQPAAQQGKPVALSWLQPPEPISPGGEEWLAVPITRLYDRGRTILPSQLLHQRIPQPYISMNPADAASLDITEPSHLTLPLGEMDYEVQVRLDETVPEGVVLVPRSLGIPIRGPTRVTLWTKETVKANHGFSTS